MRAREATRNDLLCVDLLVECPDCHDYAHPGATVCDGCGTHLFPHAYELSLKEGMERG